VPARSAGYDVHRVNAKIFRQCGIVSAESYRKGNDLDVTYYTRQRHFSPLSQFEIPLDVSHFALELVAGFGVSDFLVWCPSPPKDSQEGSALCRAPHRHRFGRSVEIHLTGHFSTIVSGRCSQAKGPVSNRTVAISAFGAFLPARHTSESEP